MKTKLLTASAILLTTSFMVHDAYSSKGGKPGYNGSPNENTCLTAGCHVGNPLNAAPGSIVISSPDLTNFVYTPGNTYTINVTVAKPGVGLFGFSMEALKSNGASAGTFVHTTPTQTQSFTLTVAGQSRTSATHKLNSGVATGTKTFTFNWTAPNPGVGTVDFYAVGNAANNNNSTSGDFIYSTTQAVLDSAVVAGIQNPTGYLEGVTVFPNPVNSLFSVSLNTVKQENLKIELYNIEGKFMELLLLKSETPGQHNYNFNIANKYSSGIYLLKIESGNNVAVKKIFIQ